MKYTKEFKAGLIVLATLVAFWFFFQYLKGNDVFTSGNIYYVDFENVDGLAPTKPVTINGLNVGSIISIEPVKNGKGSYSFSVKFKVNKDFTFNKSSIAEIYSPGFMSGKELRLILSQTPPLAKDGDKLEGRLNASITDIMSQEVTPLKNNLNNVLVELDSTLDLSQNLLDQQNLNNIKSLITNLNRTVSSFNQTSALANKMITNNDSKVGKLLEESQGLIKSSNGAIDKYGNLADQMNEKITKVKPEETLAKLEESMAKLNTLLDGINSGKGTLGKLMKDEKLYNNLNETNDNLNTLLKDFKENPKRYVNISVFGKKDNSKEQTKP